MMNGPSDMTRRDALKRVMALGAGLGAGSVARPEALWAHQGALRAMLPSGKLLTKPIPSSGEEVPVVGIGTARNHWATGNVEPLREVIREFTRIGGKVIDTAPSYGEAETALGTLITELHNREQLFIATKVDAGEQGRAAIEAQIAQSKQRIQTDRFDLLQVHNLNGVQVVLPLLREMKQAKQIRYYGITTTNPGDYGQVEQLLRDETFDVLQIDYTIYQQGQGSWGNRDVEERILPLAKDRGVAVMVAYPFGRGEFLKKFSTEKLPEWAAELGITSWAQFALKYVVSHPAVLCANPGTSNPKHIVDNLGAATGQFLDDAARRRMAAYVDSIP